MSAIKSCIKRFFNDQRGLEVVEYAIITGVFVAGTVLAIIAISAWVGTEFSSQSASLGG